MPSPVGHTLAGLCGFIPARQRVPKRHQLKLLLASVAIANLPDADFLPGLLLGNLGAFHRHGTHSLIVAAVFGIFVALLVGRWQLNRIWWGIWAAELYASHIVLDMLGADPGAPSGVQALWPLSQQNYISPITLFAQFDYSDSGLGMVRTILSPQNFWGMLREFIIMTPLFGLVWLFSRAFRERRVR
ncbi:MAG: hypothetical protein BRC41_12765 [Cyanobacteria bacterium QH_9_48_43]|jgi:inner membrane protein|nr:MAG: hypothetical protein BRC39_02735 [Cyanobacteria bacterium QH_7_48_89]PSO67194.1 MAG: hypothetical protein BRC42_16500 [Cyanobacteria bacterium QS_1_48_34]PSO69790.1 MAG: hypothetical protein BRC37_16825 [Cyanobacteria bacterium QH_3_48_40]PSO83100.1 MAG: hypothetical protein BRC41_12765 [Cyanobacteria bacterium QH_9_48_43]PSO94043.1 MAG: hypothetical protein BRC53_13450 [Cyanobacteria bacterium SW_6_48_11]PSO99066.1 MAG: hypothetical protein BRC48_00415 [Cyanobacteria bacterium QS_9_48